VTASVIAIAAVGVSLVYGILGLVNFAYGDYMAFGALVAVELKGPLGPGIVPSALLAMVATAVLSVALDLALWRPLRAARGVHELFLASIGRAARNPSPSRTGLWPSTPEASSATT
jgi:branched-subunit amino acid ABC-type transport system permease component